MTLKTATASAWLCCLAVSHAQTLLDDVDAARITASRVEGLGFYGNNGRLDANRYELRALLSPAIRPVEDLVLLPVFSYKLTELEFSGAPGSQPFGDEDLHTLNVKTSIRYTPSSSKLEYGGSVGANLSTDFEHIDGDDFTFDLAANIGYRVQPDLLIGVGVAALNLNGDAVFFPGPVVEYTPCKGFAAGISGPNFKVIYVPNENWQFSFRGDASGGDWNVEGNNGISRTISLDSYRVGAYADRRLTDQLWLSVGAGVAMFNDLEYTTTSGSRLYKKDLDDGFFGSIALRVKTW